MESQSVPPYVCNNDNNGNGNAAQPSNNPEATPPAIRVLICEPHFSPGSIQVKYKALQDHFLVTDILPTNFRGTRWSAPNLAFDKFRRRVEERFGIMLHEHQFAVDVGSEFPYLAEGRTGWYTAMQLCHDAGLKQFKFTVQPKDVTWEDVPKDILVQQASGYGVWGKRVFIVGALIVAIVARCVVGRMGS